MTNNNQSYRINTNIGEDKVVTVNLTQDYDCFDILSIKINGLDNYKKHNSKYGVIVGRVIANNGFGVPNAKISLFIPAETFESSEIRELYSYSSPTSRNSSGVRYNLLPDEQVSDCHQVVGTFPNKRFLLDNNILVEVFDKYYKYTTRTNNSGDYMLCCVPTGEHTIHMDLDLSDCGVLSQRPRDLIYKGYSVEQFENPNQFKDGTEYSSLSQIITQDQVVYVQPFWGNESLGETIGITRADIEVYYKFEPTCVFIGSVVSDKSSQGISKKCIPTPNMGAMDELVTGKGRIEMIRKTIGGSVEEFQIRGTELINGDGIWCYQIPMNLDYMCTDEYGNMVPTDNPNKGIPTRARVRFRMSMEDMEANTDNYFRAKVLVPHNPQNITGGGHEDYDYEFGTYTRDDSFRDLFWNNVYSVKSYIPRFQKRKLQGWKEEKFTGIKHCQNYGANNPMPYNNIRIRLPFMFTLMCILVKVLIKIVAIYNRVVSLIGAALVGLAELVDNFNKKWAGKIMKVAKGLHLNVIEDGLCPDLDNWYFAPLATKKDSIKTTGCAKVKDENGNKYEDCYDLIQQTMDVVNDTGNDYDDKTSIDFSNNEGEDDAICMTFKTDYLISCVEMNLAQEYKVINFDFYNDWINGLLYFPRWMRYIRPKRKFAGFTIIKSKVKSCMDDTKIFAKSRRYVQLCSLKYEKQTVDGYTTYSKVKTDLSSNREIKKSNNYHKKRGFSYINIFGKNGGICHERETFAGQHVYYLKPCEWKNSGIASGSKINLFATDLVLLGSLNDCDIYGLPQAFKYLSSTSYVMPTNLALTNMETNGPLYSFGDTKMFCSSKNQSTTTSDDPFLESGVSLTEQTLTAELHNFSGGSENYDLDFTGDDIDTIPMTEAAGISWNYTGPAQGEIDERKLYYPGGHFLGLSCINSQTNIKSCINLERICEQGVVISQRKTDVRAVDESYDGLKYVYTVPSGFISKDEIMDDDFRIMFATMNHNRLIAKKLNPNTGYRTYDFDYVSPNNFSGEFSQYAGISTPYNAKIDVVDESSTLEQYGIVNGSELDDYDEYEVANTQVHTREYSSVDYYRFRLGLDYFELNGSSASHKHKFGLIDSSKYYLPQYENSFYFYFGLNPGSTAIDEFNKQFFSECSSRSLIEREANLSITVGDFDLCEGSAQVTILVENLESPYTYEVSNGTVIVASDNTTDSVIVLTLNVGSYTIKIRDANGVELIRQIDVATDLLKGSFVTVDFNYPRNMLAIGSIYSNRLFTGGYVICENLFIDSSVTEYLVVNVAHGYNPEIDYEYEVPVMDHMNIFEQDMHNACVINLKSANTTYDIYVKYNIDGCGWNYIFATDCVAKDNSGIGLTIGPVLKQNALLSNTFYQDNWWLGTDYINQSTPDTIQRWNIRRSITNSICSSAKTTSSYINSVNGSKFVFGAPQNTNSVYVDTTTDEPGIFINEYNTPPGYNVDDEYFYYPTYGVPYYDDIRQFSSTVYSDGIVGGIYNGIVSGSSGIDCKAVIAQSPNSKLRHCSGCVFKALPSGNIYPAIYTEFEDTPLVGFLSYDEELQNEKYGIIYPTIIYPSIKSRFQTFIEYFFINQTIGGANNETKDMNLIGKCEGHIYNGLTYDKRYSGESYISFIEDLSSTHETVLSANTYDLFGTSDTSVYIRDVDVLGVGVMSINPTTLELEGVSTDVGYSIVEGYPMYKKNNKYYAYHEKNSTMIQEASEYRNVAQEATLDMSCEFYDNIRYCIVDDVMKFSGIGSADNGIEYYVLTAGEYYNTPMVSEDFVYNYVRVGGTKKQPLHVYVIGTYTENATYNTTDEVAVLDIVKEGNTHNRYGIIYFKDEDGVMSPEIFPSLIYSDNLTNGDIETAIHNAEAASEGRVKFYRYFLPTANPALNYNQYISTKCIDANKIVDGAHDAVLGVDTYGCYIIAVKRFDDGLSIARGASYKLYATPVKVSADDIGNDLLP